MAHVEVSALSKAQRDELACTYAALLLHDGELEITVRYQINRFRRTKFPRFWNQATTPLKPTGLVFSPKPLKEETLAPCCQTLDLPLLVQLLLLPQLVELPLPRKLKNVSDEILSLFSQGKGARARSRRWHGWPLRRLLSAEDVIKHHQQQVRTKADIPVPVIVCLEW